MAFSGWVAWKLTDSADILDESLPRPDAESDPAGHKEWVSNNKKLYGALLQAVPDWLRTSIYNDHKNDGLAAIKFLRNQFDANDANDANDNILWRGLPMRNARICTVEHQRYPSHQMHD